MAKITFIQPDGASQEVEAEPGITVMEAAKLNDVAGIDAECGGACACATCHIYVDQDWMDAITPASAEEIDQLDLAPATDLRSRLACQILMRPEFDGLRLRLAPGSEAD